MISLSFKFSSNERPISLLSHTHLDLTDKSFALIFYIEYMTAYCFKSASVYVFTLLRLHTFCISPETVPFFNLVTFPARHEKTCQVSFLQYCMMCIVAILPSTYKFPSNISIVFKILNLYTRSVCRNVGMEMWIILISK